MLIVSIHSAVLIAVTVDSDSLARTLGFSVAVGWFLYEPLLVAFAGGTIGHYQRNLRVVDDRTGGNVSFLKAIARCVIKATLGWYSFISMVTTRRHQAVHDLLTRSTVQIRDLAKARPHHYRTEATEFSRAGMPSRTRRVVITALYLIGCFVIFDVAIIGATVGGLLSHDCVYSDRCTVSETIGLVATFVGWVGVSVVCLALGWRGRLPGARIRAADSTPP